MVHFEAKSSLLLPRVCMKIKTVLFSVTSSYTRKEIQPSINQELRRVPNQLRKILKSENMKEKLRSNKN
jgi:hypothetical protein